MAGSGATNRRRRWARNPTRTGLNGISDGAIANPATGHRGSRMSQDRASRWYGKDEPGHARHRSRPGQDSRHPGPTSRASGGVPTTSRPDGGNASHQFDRTRVRGRWAAESPALQQDSGWTVATTCRMAQRAGGLKAGWPGLAGDRQGLSPPEVPIGVGHLGGRPIPGGRKATASTDARTRK